MAARYSRQWGLTLPSFKDKTAKGFQLHMDFAYPVLMAADILAVMPRPFPWV